MKLLCPEPCRVVSFEEVRCRVSQRKYNERFVDYFPPSKSGLSESVSIVNHLSKTLLFVIRAQVIKSRDQTNMRKEVNFNRFIINFNSCFTETYLRKCITTSKMKPLTH